MILTQSQPLFNSEQTFSEAFTAGLLDMLGSDELGAFILVLANASYDARLFEPMRAALQKEFSLWQDKLKGADFRMQQAVDDVAVFERLTKIGFDHLQLTRFRTAGIWQLQFNQLRSFRPARNANVKFESLAADFNADGFHFNKGFLRKEILFEGELNQRPVRLLYNKFPFAPLHGLLLIEPELNKPQLLTRQDHEFIWQWLFQTDSAMPLAVAYNALGAYSSVNHQHFQTFVSFKKMPVEIAFWKHNGGSQVYPLPCKRFINVEESWDYLQSLHQANVPYNLLYRDSEMYCVTRRFQGHYQHADWTGGFAWAETMGSITTTAEADFNQLDDDQIHAEMQKMFVV